MIFGTYKIPKDLVAKTVYSAIKVGFRKIDTAELYRNQEQVGEGVKKAISDGIVKREELFIITKVSYKSLVKNNVKNSINRSLTQLGLDYVDCVVLHCPESYEKNWKLLIDFHKKNKDRVRKIGVSNFNISQLGNILKTKTETKPFMNQIEINPKYVRDLLIKFCNENGIKVVAHSITAKKELLKTITYENIVQKVSETGAELVVSATDLEKITHNYELSKKEYPVKLIPIHDSNFIKYPRFFSHDYTT